MGIYDKTCPRCMASNTATTLRCTCGYRFDIPDIGEERAATVQQLAVEEKLFAEYLEARAAQAVEAATVAARAAELDPESERKAVEAVRAQQQAEKVAAELAAQRIKAAQAAHAAGPHADLPVWPPPSAPPPTRPSSPPRNGHSRASLRMSPQRVVTKLPPPQTARKPAAREVRLFREPHTRLPPQSAPATVGSRPLAAPKTTIARVPTPVAQPRPPAGAKRPNALMREPLSPVARKRPVRAGPTWQAMVTATVSQAAKQAAGAAARGARKAAKRVATATARTATQAAKHVARTTAYTARKAIEAARERRDSKRATVRVIPVLTDAVDAPGRPIAKKLTAPRAPAARRGARAQAVLSPPATQPATRPSNSQTAVASTTEVKQQAQPSEVFRRTQATKIERAVEAVRALEQEKATVECALCSATLSADAERCLCGWEVPNHVRDIPALGPARGPNGRKVDGNELTVVFQRIECPLCTSQLAPNALRCKCGWRIPEGMNELPPVSLTADELSLLSFGPQVDTSTKPR